MKSIKSLFNNTAFAIIVFFCWMVAVVWAADTAINARGGAGVVADGDSVPIYDTSASAGATVSFTNIWTWILGKDGTGSTLDADTIDGIDSAAIVMDTGNETVAGIKTFSSIPVGPASDPTTDNQLARKAYVDSVGGAATQLDSMTDVSGSGVQYYVCTDNGDGTFTFRKLTDNYLDMSTITLADFDYEPAWRMFYSNTDGDVTALAFGADGTFLMSNGAAVAPSFESLAVGHLPTTGTWTTSIDATFGSVSHVKVSGVAGLNGLYEANSTDTDYVGWMGPASRSSSYAMQLPDADPAGQVMSFAAPSGTGDPNSNPVSAITWIDPIIAGDTFSGDVTATLEADGDTALTIANNAVDAGMISTMNAYDVIPVAWMQDGTSAPDAADDSTRDPFVYRTFASDADEDLNFVWFVPSDLSGTTIQYRVKYLITNATGPTATEGVAFGLSGISAGDNDATNGTKGTVVVVTDDTLNASQHDILQTDWSGNVTITNLAAGETAECALIRDVSDTVDDYGQVVGVIAVEIRYAKNPA